jgi:hypothetical protein
MLGIGYMGLNYLDIGDPMVFFKDISDKNESLKLKAMFGAIQSVFNVTTSLKLQVAEGQKVYRYTICTPDYKKAPIGFVTYIPDQRRLDIWNIGESLPLVQYKIRSAVFRNYSLLLCQAGFDKMFERMVSVL